jgi:hypothetical protein
MSPHQVAIFIEERKWDYRRKCLRSMSALFIDVLFSIWLCGSASGKHPHHRVNFYNIQSRGCGNVGTRYVFNSCMSANFDNSTRSGEKTAFYRLGTARGQGNPCRYLKDFHSLCVSSLFSLKNVLTEIFFLKTSGSTGKPKGVVHTTGGYLLGATLTVKYVFDLHPDDKFACMADVGWITGHT